MQGLSGSIFWLVVLVGLMYFMLIKPQKKQNKMRQEMLADLKVNDKVVTLGGFYGRIVKIDDETIKLEIAENVRVKIQRTAVNFVQEDEEESEKEEKN